MCVFPRWSGHGHAHRDHSSSPSTPLLSCSLFFSNMATLVPFQKTYIVLHHKRSSQTLRCHLCTYLHGNRAPTHIIPSGYDARFPSLITTSISIGDVLHEYTYNVFSCLGFRREEPTTTAVATYRTSRSSSRKRSWSSSRMSSSSINGTVTVRTATPTPDVVYRAGASPRTIKTTLPFFLRRMLCLQLAHFLCQLF